jgi:hypothetical protein
MRKDIVISSIILMLLISIFPIAVSNNIDIQNISLDRDVFNRCYIEIEGDIYNQWKICYLKPFGDNRSTVIYWHLEFEPNSEIKIYDEKDGELLSEYFGPREINILAFGGIYIPFRQNANSSLHVSINGNVLKIISKKLFNIPDSTIESKSNCKILNDKINFNNCYIELSGEIHNDWPAIIKFPNLYRLLWVGPDIDNILFGTYCYILYENDALIKIYNEKDGDLIWEHDGNNDPLVTLIGFKGDYEYIDEPYYLDQVVFSGNALFTSIRLGEWGN